MQVLTTTVPTLALSTIYCLYQFYLRDLARRKRVQLCERVAYMLWVAAQETTAETVEV
jgi:hypothetical protein